MRAVERKLQTAVTALQAIASRQFSPDAAVAGNALASIEQLSRPSTRDLGARNRTICDLWRNGCSQRRIAEIVGLKQARVSAIVRAYQVPPNGNGGRRRKGP